MPIPNLHRALRQIDQSLQDVLALMRRFEETGMDQAMPEDYRSLYEIYQRLQEQQARLGSLDPADLQ